MHGERVRILGENLSFCHFLYHKPPHIDCTGIEHRLCCEMLMTSHLIHDMTTCLTFKMAIILTGGKQWQPTLKNLPRMQCARAVPVA
jgi:hypothetical protein